MTDLIVGAWRNGLGENDTSIVEQVEAKRLAGFRMYPQEEALLTLVGYLEGYDDFSEGELLTVAAKSAVKA